MFVYRIILRACSNQKTKKMNGQQNFDKEMENINPACIWIEAIKYGQDQLQSRIYLIPLCGNKKKISSGKKLVQNIA